MTLPQHLSATYWADRKEREAKQEADALGVDLEGHQTDTMAPDPRPQDADFVPFWAYDLRFTEIVRVVGESELGGFWFLDDGNVTAKFHITRNIPPTVWAEFCTQEQADFADEKATQEDVRYG